MTQPPDLSLVKAGSGSAPAKMDEEPITIRSLPDDVMAIVFREIVNLNSGELSEIAKCRLVSKCFRLLMHNSVHNYGSSIVKIRMLSPVDA
jgi:hypothetical protein